MVINDSLSDKLVSKNKTLIIKCIRKLTRLITLKIVKPIKGNKIMKIFSPKIVDKFLLLQPIPIGLLSNLTQTCFIFFPQTSLRKIFGKKVEVKNAKFQNFLH